MSPFRRVVVTGGSGGIGRAIIRRLTTPQSVLVNLDRNPCPELHGIHTIITDMAEPASIESAFLDVDQAFDGAAPDTFIGCAAISRPAHVLAVSAEQIDAHFAVNVRGLFLAAQAAARRMATARSGTIVLISSVAAEQAWVSESVYCMTKAATRAMMQGLAVELAPFGIRVNAVAPGPIDHQANDMASTRTDPEIHLHELERTPLARFGRPDEVAEAVALVASATWINGATITVDGGFMATGLGLFGAARDRLMRAATEGEAR